MSAFALTAYPLSLEFRRELGDDVEIVVLPELRRLSALALARRLGGLTGTAYIALEDPASETLLPILKGLASLTRARTLEIVRRGGNRTRTSRARGALHAATLAAASADAQLELRRAQ